MDREKSTDMKALSRMSFQSMKNDFPSTSSVPMMNLSDSTEAQPMAMETAPPCRYRRKIRSLVADQPPVALEAYQREKRSLIHISVGMVLACLLISVIVAKQYSYDKKGFMQDFVNDYRRHYNQILYGSHDYCTSELDAKTLIERISDEQILHQDKALLQLEKALRNDSKLISIALTGPSGVGKSLVARSLQKHFPWPENVHSYAWNTYVKDESEKFHVVRLFHDDLSSCGRNLLIIDSLAPCDREVITLVNSLLADDNLEDNGNSNKHIIIIYIFNLNTMEPTSIYNQQHKLLQNLPDTVTINFNMFGTEELKDCIRREAKIENIRISDEKLEEIVNTIDPERSGCKNVRAKVVTHGPEW